MANESLLAAIERHETLADNYGSVSSDRSKALDYYLGNPMGNEVAGRSQVISRDVWDTVEWIKPQLAEVFCSGDPVVQFSPQGPDDVQGAEQETEYINHIVCEKNDWFTVWYNWAHDALLQKVGYVIAYWDEHEDRTKEEYEGLSEDELTVLLQDPEVELVESKAEDGYISVKVQRVKQYGCVKVENVAPERVLVSHNARGISLQDPRLDFLEYWEYKTISELRDDGFDVKDDLSDHSDSGQEWEEDSRDDDNPFRNREGEEASPAARRLKVRNVWIRYDSDDDGLTELRRVIVVGKTVLEDEECEFVTLVAKCPTPLPHQHTGLSVADAVLDLQDIKTALLRGTLDNQYLANNGRFAISDRVNLDDMLVSRPGGVVRVESGANPAEHIFPLVAASRNMESVPLMEYIDRIGQKRTGVNEQSQGLDSQALSDATAYHARQLATAAMVRIKFIARVFAETGVKSLFRVVHALSLKHARKQEVVNLRNQWVVVDPRQWAKRTDMKVTIGDMDKAAQTTFLESVLQKQILALQTGSGLTTPDRVYNTLKRQVRLNGYKDENEFFSNPALNPPPPQGPPPEVLKEQAKGQVQMMVEQQKAQLAVQLARETSAIELQKVQAQLQLQATNDQRDAEREQLKAFYENQLEEQRMSFEKYKADLDAQINVYKTDQDNATKLQIAGMNAEQSAQSEQLRIGHEAAQKDADRQVAVQSKDKELKAKAEEKKAEKPKDDGLSKALTEIKQTVQSLAEKSDGPTELIRDDKGVITHIVKNGKKLKVARDAEGRIQGTTE